MRGGRRGGVAARSRWSSSSAPTRWCTSAHGGRHGHRARAARHVAGGRHDVLALPRIRRACSRSTPRRGARPRADRSDDVRTSARGRTPSSAAHRGAGKLAPENTLAALRLGHAHGYRMAEFDVKLSADGVAFLLHDATLDRTTNARGRADALTWRELALLDAGSWHSPAYAGEPLADAGRRRALVSRQRHARSTSRSSPRPGASARPAPRWRSMRQRSGRAPTWRRSCRRSPRPRSKPPAKRLPNCRARCWASGCRTTGASARCALGCVALDLKHTLLTQESVDEIHTAGLRVATWTVNDPARAQQSDRMGRRHGDHRRGRRDRAAVATPQSPSFAEPNSLVGYPGALTSDV